MPSMLRQCYHRHLSSEQSEVRHILVSTWRIQTLRSSYLGLLKAKMLRQALIIGAIKIKSYSSKSSIPTLISSYKGLLKAKDAQTDTYHQSYQKFDYQSRLKWLLGMKN